MRKRRLALFAAIWLGLLSSAVALSLLAAWNDTLPGDRSTTDWLQDQPAPGQDLSDAVRAVTGTEVVLATGAALTLILWLRGHRRQALLLAAGLVALALLQPAIKELVDRPRPDPQLIDVRAGYSSPSFPAGHVMSGTFLYGFLFYLSLSLPVPRAAVVALGIASAAVVGVVAPVNVWLGVHWPSDALGAMLWAGVILLPLITAAGPAPKDAQFLSKFTRIC